MQRITAIADTSFIVALANAKDQFHAEIIKLYSRQGFILVPQTVLAEVAYLLRRDAGELVLIRFLQSLRSSRFRLEALLEEDVAKIIEILEQYQGSRIDFVDASVMAVAERHQLNWVLTLDRRDFTIYRPQSGVAFTLAP